MGNDPTLDEQRAFYDEWHTKYRRGRFNEITAEIRLRGSKVINIVRALNLITPHILEVGCGTGWLTEKLCDLGAVTAIDLSPTAIAMARERKIAAEFIADDFYAYEFPPASFDVGVCVETLSYVTDQPRFVQKLASLIRSGGFLAVTTINKFVYERRRDILPPERGQIRKWLTKRELRKLLSPHFEILSMTTIEPVGNMGVLRLVNSYKVNALLNRLFSPERVKGAKERIGLGGGIVILGRKNTQPNV
jgi:SAM-dependent methyltransferase